MVAGGWNKKKIEERVRGKIKYYIMSIKIHHLCDRDALSGDLGTGRGTSNKLVLVLALAQLSQ